jgi:DNA-directed RNA polymerase specialized sigma24 family protein
MSGPYGAILPLIPGLRAYACSLTGHDLHLADDVVKDTILLALRNWSQLTPGTNLKIWLLYQPWEVLTDAQLSAPQP